MLYQLNYRGSPAGQVESLTVMQIQGYLSPVKQGYSKLYMYNLYQPHLLSLGNNVHKQVHESHTCTCTCTMCSTLFTDFSTPLETHFSHPLSDHIVQEEAMGERKNRKEKMKTLNLKHTCTCICTRECACTYTFTCTCRRDLPHAPLKGQTRY